MNVYNVEYFQNNLYSYIFKNNFLYQNTNVLFFFVINQRYLVNGCEGGQRLNYEIEIFFIDKMVK